MFHFISSCLFKSLIQSQLVILFYNNHSMSYLLNIKQLLLKLYLYLNFTLFQNTLSMTIEKNHTTVEDLTFENIWVFGVDTEPSVVTGSVDFIYYTDTKVRKQKTYTIILILVIVFVIIFSRELLYLSTSETCYT